MKKLILFACFIAMTLSAAAQMPIPDPQLEFVFDLDVALEGGAISVGTTPTGGRTIIPITGGTFEGPNIKGTVVAGGADYQTHSVDGSRSIVHAIYSIRTDDGVDIMVDNQGIIANADGMPYFYTTPRFDAPSDSKYDWLNKNIFVCRPVGGSPSGIKLRVWRVK